MNDNRLFQLNLNDERYLPFEGTGATSNWELDLSPENNPTLFEQEKPKFQQIIMEVQYTALN